MTSSTSSMRLLVALAIACVASGDPVTLRPREAIDLETKLPPEYKNRTVTHAFRVTESSLWFLITPNDFIPQALLRIDRSSGASRVFPLTGHPRYLSQWLHVDGKGSMWLLRQEKSHDTLVALNADGRLRSETAIQERAASYVILPDSFLSVTWDGVLRSHASDGRVTQTLALPSENGLRLDPMPDGRVAAYDPTRGSGWMIDVNRWSSQPVRFAAAEITERVAPQHVVIADLAVDADANLWATLSKIRLRDGALVVKLGPDGRHLASYRCMLPPTGRSTNPDNLMTPFLTGIHGSTLYLASHNGTVVSYRIPTY